MNLHFYHCDVCGKTITVLSDSGTATVCCGRPMRELIANRTDGAAEKHVPAVALDGHTVSAHVGSLPHPMQAEHSIMWIGLQTDFGFHFRELHPGDLPRAAFALLPGERAMAVYAYCNLHGLWCAPVQTAA